MKSRTSSCKAAAFKKDLGRFWPVWVGYILCLIIIQLMIANDDLTYWYAANTGECIALMGLVNVVYGFVVAQMLFGDLFNARMCCGLHSLPLRREQWFSTHILVGFLFSLVPTALMTGFSEIIIALYSEMVDGWQLPLYWFAASNLQYVFFFGLSVFCVMCAGSRLGATIVYGILNSFSLLAYLAVAQLYTPLLYGVVTQSTFFKLLCPVLYIADNRCIDAERVATGNTFIDSLGVEQREYIGRFTVSSQGWIYIAIIAAIGIALLVLARQMYKKRHLECAGDLLAVHWLENPFQVVFTVLCAAGLQSVLSIFFGVNTDAVYILPAIGLLAGWFVGRMLLERSTRVFRLKNFLGFGLMAAAMAGSLFITHLDPLDINGWVPRTEDVKDGSIRMNYQAEYNSDDPQVIGDMIRLHELALEQHVEVHPDYDTDFYFPEGKDPQAVQVTFGYTQNNGWLSQRRYYVLAGGESGEIMRKYFSRLETVISHPDVKDLDDLRHKIKDSKHASLNSRMIPEEYLTEDFFLALADAISADCEAGRMVQSGVFHPEVMLDFENDDYDVYWMDLNINGPDFWCYMNIYADCENILKVLEPTGILDPVRQDYENTYREK